MIILNWNNIEIPNGKPTSRGITKAKERDSLIISPRPWRMVQEKKEEGRVVVKLNLGLTCDGMG